MGLPIIIRDSRIPSSFVDSKKSKKSLFFSQSILPSIILELKHGGRLSLTSSPYIRTEIECLGE